MTSRALILALALATPLVAPAQKRPMTFDDLQKLHRIADPQISPSGKWVLFSVTDVDLAKNTKSNRLWIVPLDGSAPERALAGAAGKSNGRFSPDGKWISFTHMGQIWVAPFNDAKGTVGDDHAVTAIATGADGAIWAPDSKHILFTSSVYPECESHAPVGRQRNEEQEGCNVLKAQAEAKDPVKAQIFTELLYRHWDQYMGHTHSHIFYATIPKPDGPLDAPTDLTPASVIGNHEAPTFSLGGATGYAISPDGKEVAYEVNLDKVPAESTNNDIFVLDPTAEPSTAKKVSTSPGSDDAPAYSPDGKYLAWRSQARNGYESDRARLVRYDCSKGSIQELLPDFDRSIDEFVWDIDSSSIYFTAADHGQENLYIGVGRATKLLASGAEFGSLDIGDVPHATLGPHSHRDPIIIATRMRVDLPSELVRISEGDVTTKYARSDLGIEFANGNGPTVLSHLNDALLAQLDLPKMESFWFPGANNTKVQGFLIRPPNFDPAKKYPVKFLIHGGPQGAWGDAWSYRWNPELLAANGYVVVMINPRGSTGYGQKFLEQVSGDWGGRPYIDLMKGLNYAEQHYPFIDKTKECALGASYGGFMADYILTHTHRFVCIVTHDGMYNPQSAFGTTEELWFNQWEFRPLATTKSSSSSATPTDMSSRPKRSEVERPAVKNAATDAVVEQTHPAHPWDFYNLPANQDPFRKFSPMLAIKNAKTPTLVIHGQKDYRLDVSEGFQLFTALQLLNVPSKMLYFPDEGHWVLKPQNSKLWYETVNDWVDEWTHTNKYATTK